MKFASLCYSCDSPNKPHPFNALTSQPSQNCHSRVLNKYSGFCVGISFSCTDIFTECYAQTPTHFDSLFLPSVILSCKKLIKDTKKFIFQCETKPQPLVKILKSEGFLNYLWGLFFWAHYISGIMKIGNLNILLTFIISFVYPVKVFSPSEEAPISVPSHQLDQNLCNTLPQI